MSENLNAVAVIGIDIGKNSFYVVGLDDRGAIALRSEVVALANMLLMQLLPFFDKTCSQLSSVVFTTADQGCGSK